MFLADKIEKLKSDLHLMEKIVSLYPDTLILDCNGSDIFYSEKISPICDNIEILTTLDHYTRASVHNYITYTELCIDNSNHKIYGMSSSIEFLRRCYFDKTVIIKDYESLANKTLLNIINTYIIQFIKLNPDYKIDKYYIPKYIKDLIAFI